MSSFIDPKQVKIIRDERQRRNLGDLSELKQSIKTVGQINAVIVRRENDELILVAGERRLTSCLELDVPVKVEFWEDLTAIQAKEIELEENLKRSDLAWQDHIRACGELHRIYAGQKESWTVGETAERLSIDVKTMYMYLAVDKNLTNPILKEAQNISHAYSLLQRASERRAAAIVDAVGEGAKAAFQSVPVAAVGGAGEAKAASGQGTSQETSPPTSQTATQSDGTGRSAATTPPPAVQAPPPPPPPPLLNVSFIDWLKDYNGPKFNLIHCDFPFGIKFTGGYGQEEDGTKYESKEEDYWELVDALCANTDRIASYSSHLVFWFSMTFYTETVKRLRAAGWKVHDFPYIWYKSDGQGIIPGRNEYMRRVYETALIASRGQRPLVKMIDNTYAAPRPANSIHPSMKPEPMLRHLFSGLVDSTTDVLDPTCGSASALRAAEDVGARSILGLEINPEYFKGALAATQTARNMRKLSGKV